MNIQTRALSRNGTQIDISGVPLSLLKEYIKTRLNETPGIHLTPSPNEPNELSIEYGTRHLEHGKSGFECRQIRSGREAAEEAADVARDWFPHLNKIYIYESDDDIEPVSICDIRLAKWVQTSLYFFENQQEQSISIDFGRISGDRVAHWHIWSIIKQSLDQRSLTFLSRYPYLQLIEGCKDYNDRNHMERYLLDFFVAYDICGYL
jgi:hypothetical protein